MKVREFAVVVPLTLPSPGRVEDEINKFSRTLTPKIPTLFIIKSADITLIELCSSRVMMSFSVIAEEVSFNFQCCGFSSTKERELHNLWLGKSFDLMPVQNLLHIIVL